MESCFKVKAFIVLLSGSLAAAIQFKHYSLLLPPFPHCLVPARWVPLPYSLDALALFRFLLGDCFDPHPQTHSHIYAFAQTVGAMMQKHVNYPK